MPFSQNNVPFNNPFANELAPESQSTQQPELVCAWSAHVLQSGSSSSPFPRAYHALTATANAAGELFLFGGYHGCSTNDVYVISIRNFSTTPLGTSGDVSTEPCPQRSALIGTTFLVYGGTRIVDENLRLLNLETRQWSRVVINGPGPGSRTFHTTNVVGSKLFIFGGEVGERDLNDMWMLDLNRINSQPFWESYEPTHGSEKPLPRGGHVSVTTGDQIIIFGGSDGINESDHYYNDTWSFDISTRKWTELQCTGSIPSPRVGHAAVLVDGMMYVFGGLKANNFLDDLIGLQLSTQRWFKFHNVGQSPRRRSGHAMASDGTHVFVLGGHEPHATMDGLSGLSFIHVFDTKLVDMQVKFWDMQAKRDELLLSRDQQVEQHEMELTNMRGKLEAKGSELEALLLRLTDSEKGWTSLDELVASHDRQVGQLEKELTNMGAKLEAKKSELEAVRLRLTDAEKGWKSLDELVASRNQKVGQHEKELTEMRAKLEAKESELEALHLQLTDAEKGWTSLDELVASRDRQVAQHEKEFTNMRAKLEAKESELEAVRLRLTDAEKGWKSLDESVVSHDQQVAQHEKELASVRAKFESELEAVRLRLTDAEKGWTKSKVEADTLRGQTATGSENRDEDQVTSKLIEVMERMRVIEDEMASRRWSEKIIIDRNEG